MNIEPHQLQDRQQFEQIFMRYYTELIVYLCKYVKEVEVAEDIVQEMFCELWNKRLKLDITTSLQAFLFRSAHNAAMNYLTRVKKKTIELSPEVEKEMVLQEDMETIERDRRLYALIERLPEQRRRIFKMCFFEDLRYQDVAEKLNISVNTVKTQMGRALADLRESSDDLILLVFLKKIKKFQ